jgi:hypothetical protein
MARKTQGVQLLVQDVLGTSFSEPYQIDVILKVFKAIEEEVNPDWRRRYDELSEVLSQDVVNNWIGKYAKAETRLSSLRKVSVQGQSMLTTSYTELG